MSQRYARSSRGSRSRKELPPWEARSALYAEISVDAMLMLDVLSMRSGLKKRLVLDLLLRAGSVDEWLSRLDLQQAEDGAARAAWARGQTAG